MSQPFCQSVSAAVASKGRRRLSPGRQDERIPGAEGALSVCAGKTETKALFFHLSPLHSHPCADLHSLPLQLHGQGLTHRGSLVAGRIDQGAPCLCQKPQLCKKAQRILRAEGRKDLLDGPPVSAPEIHCFHVHIREIAPAVPCREDLLAGHLLFLKYRHQGALSGRRYSGSHAGRPASGDQYSHRVTSPFRTRYSSDISMPSFA